MQISRMLDYAVFLSVVSLSISNVIRSQEQTAPPPAITAVASAYSNTNEGLQKLLGDVREAAKRGNEGKIASFVKDMEIPNCDAWLHKMYDSDKADSWMGLCEANVFGPKEKSMSELFERLAKEDGRIITRKVNDNPAPGKGNGPQESALGLQQLPGKFALPDNSRLPKRRGRMQVWQASQEGAL